jgi:integrase
MSYQDKKKDKWVGEIEFQKTRHRNYFDTRQAAKNWEVAKRKELLAPKPELKSEDMELRTFFSLYLDSAELKLIQKTFKEKKALLQTLSRIWGGDTPVKDISPAMVSKYLENRAQEMPQEALNLTGKKKNQRKRLSKHASNKDRKNLHALWEWGKKIHNLPTNPVSNTDKLPYDKPVQYIPLEKDVIRMLEVITLEEKVFLLAYLDTGARRSEIFRWTWADDINFEKRQVRLGTRKTRDGSMKYVWMPMTKALFNALWWWYHNQPERVKESPYVFVNTHGGPTHGKPFTVRRWFLKRICDRAGVKPFGYHAIRRYAASIMADKFKAPLPIIQKFLRHEHLSTTDLYIGNIHSDLAAIMEQNSSGYGINTFPEIQSPPKSPPQTKQEVRLSSLTS